MKIYTSARFPIIALATFLGGMNPALAASGEEIYQRQCAACHGAIGAGDGPQAGQNGVATPRPLTVSAIERMTIEKAMMQGVSNTPGHGNASLFIGSELRELIDYVHKLANP